MNKKILLSAMMLSIFFLGGMFFANGAEAGCGSSIGTYEVNAVPTPDATTWGANRCSPAAAVNTVTENGMTYSKTFPLSPGSVSKWTCGTDTATVCKATKMDTFKGECGPGANKTYSVSETTWSGGLCSKGVRKDVSSIPLTFPNHGQTVNWKCLGGWDNGETDDVNCWAKREGITIQKPDIDLSIIGTTNTFKTGQQFNLTYSINMDCTAKNTCTTHKADSCKISVSGPETGEKNVATTNDVLFNIPMSQTIAGSYTYTLSCTNSAGTSQETVDTTFTNSTDKPVAVIISPKEGDSVVAGTPVQFTGSGAGADGTYKWCNGIDCGCGSILLATTSDPSGFKRTFLESQVNAWNSTALVVKTADGRESDAVRRKVAVTQNPTCHNGVKDSGEFGVDCGGVCKLCNINLSAPTNLKATCDSSGKISFSWSSVPSAERYELLVKKSGSGITGSYELSKNNITGTSYTWQGSVGQSYLFGLTAIMENGIEDIESDLVTSNVSCASNTNGDSGSGDSASDNYIPDSLCGEAAGTYAAADTHFRGDGICLACKLCDNKRAEPEYLNFPALGTSVEWVCKDANGRIEARCKAEHSTSSSSSEDTSNQADNNEEDVSLPTPTINLCGSIIGTNPKVESDAITRYYQFNTKPDFSSKSYCANGSTLVESTEPIAPEKPGESVTWHCKLSGGVLATCKVQINNK